MSVQVFTRTRPLLNTETQSVVQVTDTTTSISLPQRRQSLFQSPSEPRTDHVKTFTFDGCISSNTSDDIDHSQSELYDRVGPQIVDAAYDGFNSCVFAYGMTSSGKSYSMTGTPQNPGIIPRLCKDLFSRASDTVSFEVTYMEIYNERVRDLLQAKGSKHYRVREHPVEGPYVEGLARLPVNSYEQLQQAVDQGNLQRTVASTNMNLTSSRSHALFTIHMKQTMLTQDVETQRVSKISLVDLAGSERQSQSQTSGDRLKEGSNINKSLSALGLVITALVERSRLSQAGNARKVFVPYRDSILTWLLRTSLGGNSKTIMIATVSPALEHADETLSTLRYATRAKEIVNVPVVNEDKTTRVIRDLTNEVQRLKMRLVELEGSQSDDTQALKQQLEVSQQAMNELQSKMYMQYAESDTYSEDTFKSVQLPLIQDQHAHSTKNCPYLVTLDEDDIADSTLYLLQQHITCLGSDFDQDIVLDGDQVESQHAVITVDESGSVWLEPANLDYMDEDLLKNLPQQELEVSQPLIYVNGTRLVTKTRLSHGLRILFGRSYLFRFYNPKEAKALKKTRRMHVRSDSFASIDNFGYSSNSSESSIFSSTTSVPQSPQIRRHSLLQTRSFVPQSDTTMSAEVQLESFESILNQEELQLEQVVQDAAKQSQEKRLGKKRQMPMSDNATDGEYLPPLVMPTLLVEPQTIPQYPTVYSNVVADIPYVEKMSDFHVFHIYITISFHSTNSKTGSLQTLPRQEKWLVQRRFSELYAYFKSIKYMLPPVLKSAFPKPNVWSKLHSLSDAEVEERRSLLEVYFNGLMAWWLEIWTLKHDGNSQLSKSILERELPVLSPQYHLKEGAFVHEEVKSDM